MTGALNTPPCGLTFMRSCFLQTIGSVAFGALALTSADSFGQSVTRGPYLQRGASTSMVVRWRTDIPVATSLQYGRSLSDLSLSTPITPASRDHEAQLTSLEPQTRYYYRVVADGRALIGGDDAHYFVTSPVGGDEPFRVWAVGDAGISGRSQSGPNPGQMAVRDSFLKRYPVGAFQLFMMLGDNAYDTGSDAEYQRGVFEPYQAAMRSSVTWPTKGNHDYLKEAYYTVFSLPERGEGGGVPSGSEVYYSFNYGNVHFISLNSDVAEQAVRDAMLSWLRQDLAKNTSEWLVAFWHHPPYSRGSHDSDLQKANGDRMIWMRENVLPILESAGVDIVLSGHSHSYERSHFMTGHYGRSATFSRRHVVSPGDGGDDSHAYVKAQAGAVPHSGTVYVVAGNAGEVHGGRLNHPAMVKSSNTLGSMALSFDANELAVEMIGAGGTLDDRFIIRKAPARPHRVKDVAAKLDASRCAVEVSWGKGAARESHVVYRSSTVDGRGVIVGEVSAGRSVWKDSIKEFKSGTLTYSVRAKNPHGLGPWGEGIRVTLPRDWRCR